MLANKQRFAELSEQTKAGTVELVRRVAGEERQIVIEKLGHYPLLLTASRTVDDALAQWRGAAIYISSAAGLLLVVIAAIVVLGIRQLKGYESLVKARIEADQRIQLDATIDNMTQGLLMFDASERIVVCNRRYIEMYGLSPEVVKPGCSFRDLIAHRKETGSFAGDIDQYHREVREALAGKIASSRTIQTGDSRSIRIVDQPMINGGWVATHEDITEQLRSRKELERVQTSSIPSSRMCP